MSLIRPTKKCFIQILWSGIDSSIPTLYLFMDNRRFIFNCGEGLQRLVTQRKVKLGKIDKFFFTTYQWSHFGGLPGFLMTLRDLKNGMPFKVNSTEVPEGECGNESAIDNKKMEQILSQEETTVKTGSMEENKKQKEENSLKNELEMNASKSVLKEEVEINVEQEEKDEPPLRTIDIFAPQGIEDLMEATKSFFHSGDSEVNFKFNGHKWNDELQCNEYSDEDLAIKFIPIYSKQYTHADNPPAQNSDNSPSPSSLCYACQLHPLPGKFDAKKAKELGIPNTPVRAELQKGQSIVLENGKVIMPQDVLGPEKPGPVFLIADCPSKCYIESLVNNLTLEKYLSSEGGPHLVIHLSNSDICEDRNYREWVDTFPTHTKHIYVSSIKHGGIAYKSQYNMQFMLNHINPKVFPLTLELDQKENDARKFGVPVENFMVIKLRQLVDSPAKVFDYSESKAELVSCSKLTETVMNVFKRTGKQYVKNSDSGNLNDEIDCRDRCAEVHLERKKDFCADDKINNLLNSGKRCNDEALDGNSSKKLIIDKLNSYCHSKGEKTYPKVICLGTGASLPSKYRNVSSTLVFLNEDYAILLDCGEGTYGQLVRHYGVGVDRVLSKIKLVFISHMHADHHLGLITLIKKLNMMQGDSFVIMAPWLLLDWLSKYKKISEPLKFEFLNFKNFILSQNIRVKPVKVDHPGIAHGVVIDYNNEKITYSGDTMPCSDLIEAGMNSTLLIHEATLEDEMVEDARDRNHSTTSQAVEVAQEMNAKYLLLTHFSQRYPKIPILRNTAFSSRTAFAFDHMEVTLGDIGKFHELIPLLTTLYDEQNPEGDE